MLKRLVLNDQMRVGIPDRLNPFHALPAVITLSCVPLIVPDRHP
jgi:hypothetical protein